MESPATVYRFETDISDYLHNSLILAAQLPCSNLSEPTSPGGLAIAVKESNIAMYQPGFQGGYLFR